VTSEFNKKMLDKKMGEDQAGSSLRLSIAISATGTLGCNRRVERYDSRPTWVLGARGLGRIGKTV